MSGSIPAIGETNPARIIQAIRELFQGRSNATGTITLTANAASTTKTAANIGKGAQIFLSPKTANAAAAVATTYVTAVGAGSFTLTHANNAQVDKTFGWVALG